MQRNLHVNAGHGADAPPAPSSLCRIRCLGQQLVCELAVARLQAGHELQQRVVQRVPRVLEVFVRLGIRMALQLQHAVNQLDDLLRGLQPVVRQLLLLLALQRGGGNTRAYAAYAAAMGWRLVKRATLWSGPGAVCSGRAV